MDKLYHSAQEEVGLQRPQNFDKKQPYTVLTLDKTIYNNGENK